MQAWAELWDKRFKLAWGWSEATPALAVISPTKTFKHAYIYSAAAAASAVAAAAANI